MNNRLRSRRVAEGSVSRREFIAQTATVGLGFSIIPRRVLGGDGYIPPSDKVNIAFVGVGSQGLSVMLRFLRESDVQGVAVCDVNKSGANHPQWTPTSSVIPCANCLASIAVGIGSALTNPYSCPILLALAAA